MSSGWVKHLLGQFQLDVSWKVEPGQVLVLFGPSGAGKTQTLRAIAGLNVPDQGRITIGETLVFDRVFDLWTPPYLRRIGYVPQDYKLFPHLTVEENIKFGRWQGSSLDVGSLLETFDLIRYAAARPHELSGGQQQRVAIARALAVRPRLLLLDEPFAALDAELRRSLRGEFRKLLVDWNIPVILVTHDKDDALALGDKLAVLEAGEITEEGLPLDVLGQPSTPLVARIGGVENVYTGRVTSKSHLNGVMICRVGQIDLEIPLAQVDQGDAIQIGLRSRDVLLATEQPRGISTRNVLSGRISALVRGNLGVEVTVDCYGTPVVSHVTQETVENLSLETGTSVWVVVKSSSLIPVAIGN